MILLWAGAAWTEQGTLGTRETGTGFSLKHMEKTQEDKNSWDTFGEETSVAVIPTGLKTSFWKEFFTVRWFCFLLIWQLADYSLWNVSWRLLKNSLLYTLNLYNVIGHLYFNETGNFFFFASRWIFRCLSLNQPCWVSLLQAFLVPCSYRWFECCGFNTPTDPFNPDMS